MLFGKKKHVPEDDKLNIFDADALPESELNSENKSVDTVVIEAEVEIAKSDLPNPEIVIEAETQSVSSGEPVADIVIEAEKISASNEKDTPEIVIEAEEKAESSFGSPIEDKQEEADQAETEVQEESTSSDEIEDEEDLVPLNDFEKSIKEFSLADVGEVKPKKATPFDVFRVFVLVLCAAVFTVSIWTVIRNVSDKVKGDKIYGEILDSVADGFALGGTTTQGGYVSLLAEDKPISMTPTMDDIIKNGIEETKTPSSHAAELAKMRASLESLRSINKDIYGWIQVPGTNINYPVAQSGDNKYYLDHAYNGDNLVNGSIFADYRCKPLITDNYNTVLYGHNITSGSMFHDVQEFFKEEVFKNTNVYLYTFDGIYVFKPFSIHETAFDSGFVDTYFPDGESFVKFAEGLRGDSDIKNKTEFTKDDRIITLSTCTNGLYSKRYALHAVLVETITE